MFFDK
jgi:hypothetical protein